MSFEITNEGLQVQIELDNKVFDHIISIEALIELIAGKTAFAVGRSRDFNHPHFGKTIKLPIQVVKNAIYEVGTNIKKLSLAEIHLAAHEPELVSELHHDTEEVQNSIKTINIARQRGLI